MTHPNHLTNGASLEDCHTNFFALTDLCGIKWRKLVLGERPNASSDPLDDPVLRSYSRCLAVDILCVWRRVAAPKPEPDQTGNLFEISLSGTGNSGSVVHPPLSLTAAKELWIFWYGEEPDLTDLLAPELLKSSEGGQGSWESGITYECRSLLFKALHNLIERCLLSKDVVRLGRWFVQPCLNRECTFGKSSHHLSFSFAFFVHGESTVCASMDLRVHPAVRPLTPEYLAESGQTSNNETKPKPVILAPFGLAATLTGQSFRVLDNVSQKAFDDWCSFYPLCNKENSNLPPMVEVLSGGVKMRYPSKYVLITDLDEENYDIQSAVAPPVPISDKAINDLGNSITMHSLPPSSAKVLERAWQNCITSPFSLSNPIKEENCSPNETNSLWDFIDPTHKASCICAKSNGGSTPQGGSLSHSRNPNSINSIPESLPPISSVGSPGSAGPSPHPNSSLSQPTSVQPPDQLIPVISPIPPPSNNQPSTPVEHLDKNTPVTTPTDQQDSKSTTASPCVAPTCLTVEPPPTNNANNNGSNASDQVKIKSEPNIQSSENATANMNNINSDGKSVSCNNSASANCVGAVKPGLRNILSLLKRPTLSSRDYENVIDDDFMPHQLLYDYSTWDAWMNHPVKRFKPNETLQNKNRQVRDLYVAERIHQPDFLTSMTTTTVVTESNIKTEPMTADELDTTLNHELKQEPVDDDGKAPADLFTVVGLQPSYKDLDQLFEEDNSGSSPLAIQVNTPPGSNKSSMGIEDTKKIFASNSTHTGIFRPEELSKMFPTPPSLEHHPNSSPCAGLSEHQLDVLDSPNLGSPNDEPIEDWSYVFVPPTISKFVGSSKYAPLMNLPSQSQPIVTLPPNVIYKPSWQQQHNIANANNNNNTKITINNNNIAEKVQQSPHSLQLQQSQQSSHQQQLMNLPQSAGMLTPNSLSRPSSVTPISIPNMMNYVGGPGINLNSMQHASLRTDMSPISPAAAAGHSFAPNVGGSPMQYARRGLLPPPPPYEIAVASPATSTSSYLNKQFNSHEPPTPTVSRVPETNALLLNILLYDTALNVFKDHNFDSCTLCVCNAGHKCVGNIRGSDSGVYLALPGHTLDPSSLYNSNNCGYGGYGIDSPAGIMATNHNAGYLDEDPIKCSCGFSAVVNRRLAHRSGLFYEDEMEITGMAEDPANYKRKSQFPHLLGVMVKSENSSNERDSFETLSHAIMDLLQDQCALIQSSSNSIQRAIRCFRSLNSSGSVTNALINMLEYTDAQDIICLALDQSRMVFENQFQNRLELTKPFKYGVSVHKWPYVKACGPRSNRDIVRVMKSMRPLLQDAFHKKCTTRLWDAPYTVQGPLTWRQFHRMASSSSGQCEPQPIPSVVVGHEKDWLSVSPYAIQYWDKLMLEPYSYARDVAYIIIAPDNDYVIGRAKSFFKELSTTYEMCKLGRHNPMKGWDGVLRVNSKSTRNEPLDDWFSSLGETRVSELLKMYAHTCQHQLVPYLSKIPSDKSLLDPPEGMNTSNSNSKDRSLPSPMLPPSTPDSSQTGEKAPSTPKSSDVDMETQRESFNNSASPPSTAEPLGFSKDEVNPPCIVIYVIDPFSIGYDSQDVQRLACLALLRCYSNILNSIPESVRSNINFQIISMESVMELGRNRDRLRASDEMRCLALSVFSQCRRHLTHSASVKSLTGFGTAANMELFLKSKDEKNRAAYKLYTPPYILSGRHEKSENAETFGTASIEQQSSVMYCSYCLSEDQRWLLAVATDDRGELLETVTINIDIPNRRRRKKASARRLGLQKLMDFIIGVISQSGQPWRIVVGRIGRIGHGELKGWSWLLSKQNLLKASKQLKDICEQCSLMHPHTVPSILSACLVTLEPDSNLRVMPDQFTPDERFSQISMQSPLSTPQDVTCTHILVFPTSAKAQSSQSAFHEQHINGFGLDEEELFDLGDGDDGMDDVNMNGFDDIFGQDFDNEIQMPQASPERSRVGSPEDNCSRQSPSRNCTNGGSGRNSHSQQEEEVGQVLQQPLALGYMVSTAPTGRMPTWFWSSCPHLENVCPVFLKTALHLHSPSIQQNTDDLLHQNQSSATDHPLDSTFTADVLRYVLEGYNVLSWLAMDSNTRDRLSCLPIHVQVLMQLYHMTAVMA
ncbi:Mediator of RNA polymerase II transcription subunit 13 [Pseudolycoriella hygida]|uniref:Mediator of RNA polymerase II transcription subunit 13 n=1 Tax=Pseudolycoriella hygida TaxID=35572 RepID=A0A9Q0S423_9DIPT|nr:Mediator of RNA polymerase II transcription subunit 13 [Pseudolycoriella hygida]